MYTLYKWMLTTLMILGSTQAFAASTDSQFVCDVPRGLPFVRLLLESADTDIVAAVTENFNVTAIDETKVDAALDQVESLNVRCTTWEMTDASTGLKTYSVPQKVIPYQEIHKRGSVCKSLARYKKSYPDMFKDLSTFRTVVEAYELARLQRQNRIAKGESLNSIRADYPILQSNVDETIHSILIEGCSATLFPETQQ